MVAVTVILSATVRGRSAARLRFSRWCRGRAAEVVYCWQPASVVQVAELESSITCTFTRPHSTPLPHVAGCVGFQGRSVSVGSAGMSHSETLETLSRGRAGWAWCFDRAGLPLPLFCGAGVTGANGSQCTYGECTQEQAARPAACEGTTAGAQRCGWVTAWPVVSGQMEVVSMMRLDEGAPLEIERQRPRAVRMLSPFLQREPRHSLSVRTTVWRRPRYDSPQLLHDCRLLRVVWCDRGATRRALSQAVVITSAGDAARRLSQWLRFLWTVPALKKQARGGFRSSLGAGSRRRRYRTCPYITGGVPVLSCIVCGLVTRVLHASRTSTITARLRADLHKAPWSMGDGSLAESNTLPRAIESCRCPSLSN